MLYIDIKITEGVVKRLVLHRHQTPYDAAIEFILRYDIPAHLHEYLIRNVEAQYSRVHENANKE